MNMKTDIAMNSWIWISNFSALYPFTVRNSLICHCSFLKSLLYVLIPFFVFGYYFYNKSQIKPINESETVQSQTILKTDTEPLQNINDQSTSINNQEKIKNSTDDVVNSVYDVKTKSNIVPIYRFYHKENKDHFYTKNKSPKGKWKAQGIEFYANKYFID